MFTNRLIDVATNVDVFIDGGLKSILVTKLEIRDMPDTYHLVIENSDKLIYQELDVAFSETYTFDTATLPQGTGDFLFYLMRIYIGDMDTGYYSLVFQSNLAKSMEEVALCAREHLRIHGRDGQIELRIEELLNDLNTRIIKNCMEYMKTQRVALICENSVEYVDKLLDIWNNGDCAVLLDWRIPFETTYRMMLEAGVQACFIESRTEGDENNY